MPQNLNNPLHLCRGVSPSSNNCAEYDTTQPDGDVLVMLELWGMRSIPSLSSLLVLVWLGVVAPNRVLSIGQIELDSVLILN